MIKRTINQWDYMEDWDSENKEGMPEEESLEKLELVRKE